MRNLTSPSGWKLEVLVADDDAVTAVAVQRAVTRWALPLLVRTASDGEEALRELESWPAPVDRLVLLTDLKMPRMTGLELMVELRARPRLAGVPVTIMSSSSDERDVLAAYNLHCAGYYVKPQGSAEFLQFVRSFCAYWTLVLRDPPPLGH